MSDLKNVNLRGIRLSPSNKQSINYYLIVMDQPSTNTFGPDAFTVQSIKDGDTEINYSINHTLKDIAAGEKATTCLVGIFTDKKLAAPTSALSVKVTDKDGNTAKGNPNKGKPPVIDLVDTSNGFVPTVTILQSTTAEKKDYFVTAMVNTNYDDEKGGFSNSFSISAGGTSLTGQLESLSNKGTVAAISGCYSTKDQYSSITISYQTETGSPVSFNYNNPHQF